MDFTKDEHQSRRGHTVRDPKTVYLGTVDRRRRFEFFFVADSEVVNFCGVLDFICRIQNPDTQKRVFAF